MEALSQEQKRELAALLEAERKRLRSNIRDELLRSDDESYGELAGRVHDTGDEAMADLLSDINTAVLSKLILELREVEAARQRLADDKYGLCIDCDEPIGFERLKAYPTALRCLEHQEEHERLYADEGNKPTL